MSRFETFDKQTFIVDTADAYAERRITRRELLRRLGLAGIGFSAFGLGMLGGHRRGTGVVERAHARGLSLAGGGLPDNQARWLREVGGKFRGARIRYTTEATPPSIVLNQIKKEFTDPTGIEVEIEIVPLEQVLAEVTRDVQGQLGTNDLYYLDQSWIATFARDCVNPFELYQRKPELAMPDFDWDDFSRPLVDGVAQVDGQWIGIPFDIPIFILMYRKDLLDKHGLAVPTTYDEFTAAVRAIGEAEKANGIFGTGLQARSGHYSLECDWTQAIWGHGGSVFGKDRKFSGNDARAVEGLRWYQELLSLSPPSSTASDWDGQLEMMVSGQVALVQSWAEFFPSLDADGSRVKGLWKPARPLTPEALRPAAECGFDEKPNAGHQGGSPIALSKHSKNPEAAWIFMQWSCCKEIATRCTLVGGVAPTRNSSYADPRVTAKAKVGPGTTRHLDAVKWTIDNAIATEPHMTLWAGLSTNEIPTELGKLLTGQAYGGDAKQCLDAIAAIVDARVEAAGLL